MGWTRRCPFLMVVLASQALVNPTLAQDSPAKTASSLANERQLDYALRIAMAQRQFVYDNSGRARQLLESCPQDLRRWEWHYLHRRCNPELQSTQILDELKHVVFSPDGSRYALYSRWRMEVRSVTGNKGLFERKGFVRNATFSDDGQTLVVAAAGSVSFLDASNGKMQKKIEIPRVREEERITNVDLSPIGDRLAVVLSYTENGNRKRMSELTIWDVKTAMPIKTFSTLPASTVLVRFSPDGKLVATGSAGMGAENTPVPGEVRIWNLETGKRIQLLRTTRGILDGGYFLSDFAFSHDGAHVALASSGGGVKVWKTKSGENVHTLKARRGVRSVAFDRSGARLVAGGDDLIVRVWDMATGAQTNSMRGHGSPIKMVRFLDDRRIASGGRSVRVWDAAATQTAQTYRGFQHKDSVVFGIAFGPKSDLLATGSMHAALVRDLKSGRHSNFNIPTSSNRPGPGVGFSPDGRLFGTADREGGKLWNVETGGLVRSLLDGVDDFDGTMFSIAFAPKEPLVASAGQNQLAIWNRETGKLVRKRKIKRGQIECVVFTPNGKQVVTGHQGWVPAGRDAEVVPGEVDFWDSETGELKLKITAGGTESMRISMDPDGRRIAVTTDDRVTLFDTNNGAKLLDLSGHSASVNDVAFSPDGDRIATGSNDQTIKIWDANTGQELLLLRGHDCPVLRVTFSPNGVRLASSSAGPSEVKVWDATKPGELSAVAQDYDE